MKISDFFRGPLDFSRFCSRVFIMFQRSLERNHILIPIISDNSVRISTDFMNRNFATIPRYSIDIKNPFYPRHRITGNPYTILKWDIMEAIGNLEVNRT